MNKVIGTVVLAFAVLLQPALASAAGSKRPQPAGERREKAEARTASTSDRSGCERYFALVGALSMCRARNEGAIDCASTQFGSRKDSVQA